MKSFKELGLSDSILKVVDELKFEKPSEIQEKAIPLAMEGKDVIGGSATGSGKTLAFGAPIIEKIKEGPELQALILTPTRELAEQISESLNKFGKYSHVKTVAVYGGVDIENQMRKMSTANIIAGTPGRILDHLERNTINLSNVEFLVLDEVDRMFDMGFLEDVEKIISHVPKKRQTMIFSATISPEIDHLAKKHTNDAVEVAVESMVDPSKLRQIYYDVSSKIKFSLLVKLLKKEQAKLVMVFCNTRSNADFIGNNLKLNDIDAHVIHGGLTQNRRSNVLGEFHKGKTKVLVCTDVAARGLDIKGVSHVYNYDIPQDPKNYVHRIGRTARAGEDGIAVNIVSDRDYDNFRNVNLMGNLNIEEVETPKVERAKMKINRDRRNNRFGGRRGNFGGKRNDSRGRRNFGRR